MASQKPTRSLSQVTFQNPMQPKVTKVQMNAVDKQPPRYTRSQSLNLSKPTLQKSNKYIGNIKAPARQKFVREDFIRQPNRDTQIIPTPQVARPVIQPFLTSCPAIQPSLQKIQEQKNAVVKQPTRQVKSSINPDNRKHSMRQIQRHESSEERVVILDLNMMAQKSNGISRRGMVGKFAAFLLSSSFSVQQIQPSFASDEVYNDIQRITGSEPSDEVYNDIQRLPGSEPVDMKSLYAKYSNVKELSIQDKIQVYTYIIQDYPSNNQVLSDAYGNRSVLKEQLGQVYDSKLDYIQSLVLDPSNKVHNAEFKLGSLYLDVKMPEKAIPELEKALEIVMRHPESILEEQCQCFNYLAAAHMDLGNYKQAEKYLEESIAGKGTQYIDTARINYAICKIMDGFAYNIPLTRTEEDLQKQAFKRAKETLEPVTKNLTRNQDKRLEVADAKALYSLVLLILNNGKDNFVARNMFAEAVSIDERYNYKGWIKNSRMYPQKIEDVYIASDFYQFDRDDRKIQYERFPMDTMGAIMRSID